MNTHRGTIILLNGVSSSGKSTLAAKLLQNMSGYFPLAIDNFDEFIGQIEDRPNQKYIPVDTEVLFHKTIAMFSDAGIDVIVDHILYDPPTRKDFYETLAGYPVFFVGVHCPIAELERRERERGDRRIGQGKTQLDFVHKHEVYDIEVDTYAESIEVCAKRIIAALNLGNFPRAWRKGMPA